LFVASAGVGAADSVTVTTPADLLMLGAAAATAAFVARTEQEVPLQLDPLLLM
jgi:hypothetical protein